MSSKSPNVDRLESQTDVSSIADLSKSLADLPSNVIVDIFARLPLGSLFVARSVCKTFTSLTIPNPHFITLHSSNASQVLVFQFGGFQMPSQILCMADPELDYKYSELKPLFQLPKLSSHSRDPALSRKPCIYFLVNSCNGLLFFLENGLVDDDRSIVCNPVTNEYIVIPEVHPQIKSDSLTKSMWLGFSPATDQYKVLRIFRWMNTDRDEFLAQVSVVGSDSWRYVDDTPRRRPHFYSNLCETLVDGIMYWHHPSWSDLFSFDFERETFREVAMPPKFSKQYCITIGVLGGCLCLTCNDSYVHCVDLWVMRKCGSWIKEFVVDTGDPVYSPFKPLEFLRNGQILMLLMGNDLVCYDPRSKTLRYFGVHRRLRVDHKVVALTPTFVHLKDTLKVEKVLSGSRPMY